MAIYKKIYLRRRSKRRPDRTFSKIIIPEFAFHIEYHYTTDPYKHTKIYFWIKTYPFSIYYQLRRSVTKVTIKKTIDVISAITSHVSVVQRCDTFTDIRLNTVDKCVMTALIAMSVIGILLTKSGLMKRDRFVLFSRKEHKLVIGVVQNSLIIIQGLWWFAVKIQVCNFWKLNSEKTKYF